MIDMDKMTLRQVQKEFGDYHTGELVRSYIKVWKQVFPVVMAKHRKDRTLPHADFVIGDDSSVSLAIPCIQGRGRWAKLITEYLITLQNNFLDSCMTGYGEYEKIQEVEVTKLTDSHIVCVDKSNDLLPLIKNYTSYEIKDTKCGQHHHISYNLSALEKLVLEQHVIYKKKIMKKSLPCIQYADIGVCPDWDKIAQDIEQIPLPVQLAEKINEIAHDSSLSDICDGIRNVRQAMSFLAKESSREPQFQQRSLQDYMKVDLLMTINDISVTPVSVLICHTLDLFLKLTWHRSVRFVQRGSNPYKDILRRAGDQAEILDAEVLRNLREAFSNMDVENLQEHINEMLMTGDISVFNGDWSLNSVLENLEYLQDDENDSWMPNLPEEVLFKHVFSVFRMSVDGIPNAE